MNIKRRLFIRAGLGVGLLTLSGVAGLLTPRRAYAAWPKTAFDARTVEAALKELNAESAVSPGELVLTVPELAENGSSVPITVSSRMEGVESISVFASKNFNPLIAVFKLGEGVDPYVETRIKMAESADVVAVAKVKDKLYSVSKPVKVAVGGCSG